MVSFSCLRPVRASKDQTSGHTNGHCFLEHISVSFIMRWNKFQFKKKKKKDKNLQKVELEEANPPWAAEGQF